MKIPTKIPDIEIVEAALNNREFVAEFNRLTGCKLGQRRPASALDAAIDNATGYAAQQRDEEFAELVAFAAFVQDVVIDRMPTPQEAP